MGRLRARGVAWIGLAAVVSVVAAVAVAHASAANVALADAPITTNPYTGSSGPPNCTWYAWQRLHDTLAVDMQDTANAGDWATLAQRPNEFWWEPGKTYVAAQVLPGLTATPSPGDVVVFPDAVPRWAYPYHVAFVEAVETGRYFISEQSYQDYGPGTSTKPYPYVSHRWISIAAMRQAEPRTSFIHFAAPIGDDAAYVSESAYPTVSPGQQVPISFTERNTGFHTWSDAGGYALVCLSDCMGATSVGFGGASVAPGQQVTFSIALTAPTATGVYHSAWQLERGGVPFGNRGVFMAVTVALPDDARWQPMPQSVVAHPGQLAFVVLTYENVGTATWTAAGGYTLACDPAPADSAGCLDGRAPGLLRIQVAPGQAYTFVVMLKAPTTPGTYRTYWHMYHNGAAFGDASGYVDVTVAAPGATPTGTAAPGATPSGTATPTGTPGATPTGTPAETPTPASL